MVKTGKSRAAAYASILLAATLWGVIGIWNRTLMQAGLSPLSIVLVRNFGGCVLLSAVFAVKDRRVFAVKKEHLKYFFGTGVVSILFFTCCYFTCQQIASLAVASILLYTAPAFVVVLSAVLWKEAVTGRKLTALGLTLTGCALVCGVAGGDVHISLSGLMVGLGSGFFYALYSIFGRYALAHYDSMTVTVWTFLFAGPASLVLIRPQELQLLAQPKAALAALVLVVFATVLPYLFYTGGLSRVEAGAASIIASVEPVVAALVGAMVFNEPVNVMTGAGILLVLAGVVILR